MNGELFMNEKEIKKLYQFICYKYEKSNDSLKNKYEEINDESKKNEIIEYKLKILRLREIFLLIVSLGLYSKTKIYINSQKNYIKKLNELDRKRIKMLKEVVYLINYNTSMEKNKTQIQLYKELYDKMTNTEKLKYECYRNMNQINDNFDFNVISSKIEFNDPYNSNFCL